MEKFIKIKVYLKNKQFKDNYWQLTYFGENFRLFNYKFTVICPQSDFNNLKLSNAFKIDEIKKIKMTSIKKDKNRLKI
jgi:hypothetical protein